MNTKESIEKLSLIVQSDIESRQGHVTETHKHTSKILILVTAIIGIGIIGLLIFSLFFISSMRTKISSISELTENKFKLVSQQLNAIKTQVEGLQDKVEVKTQDRWTKENHKKFEDHIETVISKLSDNDEYIKKEITSNLEKSNRDRIRMWSAINKKNNATLEEAVEEAPLVK